MVERQAIDLGTCTLTALQHTSEPCADPDSGGLVKKTREFLTALRSRATFLTLRGTHVANKKWLWIAPSLAIAVALGAPRIANAYKVWQITERRAAIDRARAALATGADGLPEMSALLAGDPDADPAKPEIAAAERAKWSNFDPAAAGGSVNPGTRTWLSLGPQAARSEFNGSYYKAMDSGRPNTIAVHPTKPNTVYLATSGGGVWQADDFGNFPTWFPITDTLGSLAIGAMSVGTPLDASGNPTIWLGLGDFVDQQFGAVVKSSNGGNTWGTPIFLNTALHPADGKASSALNVRDLKTDPNDANKVLVATDDGFYMSTNGGTSFNLVDLPNTTAFGPTREGTWQIVYIGQVGGVSQWVVSGV